MLIAGVFVVVAIAALFISSLPAANIRISQTDLEQAAATVDGLITRELAVSEGDTFTVTLFSAGSAGMRWGVGTDKVNIVRQDGARELLSPFIGGINGEKWTFKAVGRGQATISMSYRSVAQLVPPPPIRNTLKITVTVE